MKFGDLNPATMPRPHPDELAEWMRAQGFTSIEVESDDGSVEFA